MLSNAMVICKPTWSFGKLHPRKHPWLRALRKACALWGEDSAAYSFHSHQETCVLSRPRALLAGERGKGREPLLRVLYHQVAMNPELSNLEAQGKGSLLLTQAGFPHPYSLTPSEPANQEVLRIQVELTQACPLESPCTSYADWRSYQLIYFMHTQGWTGSHV